MRLDSQMYNDRWIIPESPTPRHRGASFRPKNRGSVRVWDLHGAIMRPSSRCRNSSYVHWRNGGVPSRALRLIGLKTESESKSGHSQILIRPLGVKTGHDPGAKKNILRTENKCGTKILKFSRVPPAPFLRSSVPEVPKRLARLSLSPRRIPVIRSAINVPACFACR